MVKTNRHNLPDVFVRAINNDQYDSGGSDFTATSLSMPPRAYALLKTRGHEAVTDVADKVDAFLGTAVHKVAERAARPGIDICEQRYFTEFLVDGEIYKLSAQLDLYETDTKTLYDWKTAKSAACSKKYGYGKTNQSWIKQLNVASEILRRNKIEVRKLNIIAILKDWKEDMAGSDLMPNVQVVSVELPMWEPEKTQEYIRSRIRAHVAALKELPVCLPVDNFNGSKCARWCDANAICDQWQKTKVTGLLEEKEEQKEKQDVIRETETKTIEW